ncbi:MAG: TetR/AcrR family transcriptional regulator [Pleurocapsa minor GSE-CHR-MK-17-07R]|jgi:AcrR family transcriptional regulator|nr:TetR/AcrR family transcriptional regulator [Pleurocapsa minor GSE-CHR-MK 17-07R]
MNADTQARPRTKAAQAEHTRALLIDAARELFTQHGYASTATEDIVAKAAVTRGALYHHFGSKEKLFEAVMYVMVEDIARQIEEVSSKVDDPWESFVVGCHTMLRASLDPSVRQIVYIDAQSVLGGDAWAGWDKEPSEKLLYDSLVALQQAGLIRPLPIDGLMCVVGGALATSGVWIATTDDPERALNDCLEAFNGVIEGLRIPPSGDARG